MTRVHSRRDVTEPVLLQRNGVIERLVTQRAGQTQLLIFPNSFQIRSRLKL
ncbi:unnamed protein product [Haemonchus placei]|uniref:Uncharacterized protein n=1 Tax=Haemonchus placei TaxID=6290 RepID=A0A3P7ZME5_HAEPC|nr:unnamed protein product [Haemonchus placei]